MNARIQVHRHDQLRMWIIDRPEARHAIDMEMMEAFEQALTDLEQDPGVKVLMCTASDNHFISGGDLKAFRSLITAEEGKAMADRMMAILDRIERLPLITVCYLNGPAYGGGCEFALSFDQMWMHTSATMTFSQSRFAVNTGWGGQTRLMERVGPHKALAWLSSRQPVDAPSAIQSGLADRMIPSGTSQEEYVAALKPVLETDSEVLRAFKETKTAYLVQHRGSSLEVETRWFPKLWAADLHHSLLADFARKSDQV